MINAPRKHCLRPKPPLALLPLLPLLLVAAWLLAVVPGALAADLFVVGSYHEGDACGQPQYDAAIAAIRDSGFTDLTFQRYYLNSRVLSQEEVAAASRRIITELRVQKPRFVITIDDAAFALLYEEVLKQPETQLIFSGLNRSLDYYNDRAPFMQNRVPTANITGVFEYLFMREQLDFLEILLDRTHNRVALLNSADPVGRILRDQIIAELRGTRHAKRIISFEVEDVPAMLAAADAIQADKRIDAWLPLTLSVFDPAQDRRLTLAELAPLLLKRIRKIDLTINASFAKFGFFGGVGTNFQQMGFEAGYMATKLLKGIPIHDLPIVDARRSLIAINRKRMGELGIKLDPARQSIVDLWIP